MAQLGKPYVWGATGPDAYDFRPRICGLRVGGHTHGPHHLPVAPRRAAGPADQHPAGDLLFSAGTDADPGHVVMYLGGG